MDMRFKKINSALNINYACLRLMFNSIKTKVCKKNFVFYFLNEKNIKQYTGKFM